MMRKSLAAAAIVFATVAIGSLTPAEADEQRPLHLSADMKAQPPECTASGFTPTSITLAGDAAAVTFQLVGTCPVWWITVPELGLYADESATVETIDPDYLSNTDAGRRAAVLGFCDDVELTACGELATSFVLRRYTSFGGTYDAYPEPINELATLRMTATLQRFNWETGRFDPYTPNNGIAVIQFQPVGGHFFDYKQVAIGPGGVVNGAVVARLDGAWRYRFPGNIAAGAQFSLPDYVEVR
jgi:hypothetical protein